VGLHIASDPDRIKAKQPDTMGAREISALLFRILNVSNLTRVRALRTGLRATMCISPQSA